MRCLHSVNLYCRECLTPECTYFGAILRKSVCIAKIDMGKSLFVYISKEQ